PRRRPRAGPRAPARAPGRAPRRAGPGAPPRGPARGLPPRLARAPPRCRYSESAVRSAPSEMHPPRYANTVIAAVVVVGVSCARPGRHTPDDTAVVVIESPMLSADPRAQTTNYDGKLSHLIADGLTAVDTATMEPRLDLAANIE